MVASFGYCRRGPLFSYAITRIIRPLGALLIFEITLPLSSAPQDGPHVHCPVLSLALLYPGSTSEHEYTSSEKYQHLSTLPLQLGMISSLTTGIDLITLPCPESSHRGHFCAAGQFSVRKDFDDEGERECVEAEKDLFHWQ